MVELVLLLNHLVLLLSKFLTYSWVPNRGSAPNKSSAWKNGKMIIKVVGPNKRLAWKIESLTVTDLTRFKRDFKSC